MRLAKIVVVCATLAVGSTLTLEARQGATAGGQGGRGGAAVTSQGSVTLRLTGVRTPLEAKVVKGMPYSAEVVSESVQTLGDGNRIVQRTTGRVYRDADGRVRREEDRASGSPSISITDPIAGTSTTLNADRRTAMETAGILIPSEALRNLVESRLVTIRPVPSGAARGGVGVGGSGTAGADRGGRIAGSQDLPSLRAGGAGGRGGAGGGARAGGAGREERVEESLPNRTIEGVVCSGVRRTTTIPAGAIGNDLAIKVVSEEWTSVDLQVLVLTDTNDPRAGRSTYQLQRINRANPDASLFKVPGDYTVTRVTGRGRGGDF